MSIGIDKLAHMNIPALSDILLAHSAAEGTGVVAIGDLPKLLNAGNLKMPDSDETIAEHYRQFCNRTLLDNWYFVNPVNQRGQTEYADVNYTIDRWRTYPSVITTLLPDGIRVNASANDYRSVFMQRIEHFKELEGKTVTLSALAKLVSGSYFTLSYGTAYDSNITEQAGYYKNTEYEVISFTFIIPNGIQDHFNVSITPGNKGIVDVAAMKLELGHRQTLAHKENNVWVLNEIPDYATELAKCQRYFYKTQGAFEYRGIAINQWYMNNGTIELPVSMRIKPTCKVFDRHGNAGKISIRNNDESVNGILTPLSNRTLLAYAPDAGFTIDTEYDFAIEADANL